MEIKRGEIYLADLPITKGHIQAGKRPVVVVQNDIGNKFSPTTIVVCMTKQLKKGFQPTHVHMHGIPSKKLQCQILCEQMYTVDKTQLIKKIGQLSAKTLYAIDKALKISIGLL